MRHIFRSLGFGLLFPALAVAITLTLIAGRGAAPAAAAALRAPQAHIASVHTRVHRRRHVRKRHGVKRARVAAAMPAEGIFGGCDYSNLQACEQNLQTMHAAGFEVNVEPVWSTLANLSALSAYAQSIGMSIMWQINDPGFWGGQWAGSSAPNDFPQFAAACGCTASDQVLDYMIKWLAAQPGTYGYYAADDELLTPSEKGALTQYVSEIRSDDPNHMIMVGANASQGTEFASTGATLGNEIYPVTTNSLMPYQRHQDMWQSVAQSIAQDQRSAKAAGTQSAFILQSFTFGDNLSDGEAVGVCTPSMSAAQCAGLLQYPSAAAQLELRDQVLEHATPKLILWYTFDQANASPGRWSALTQAISAPAPATAAAARARKTRGKHGARRARRHGHAHTVR